MKYVLFYESADDVLATAPAHFPAHSARGREFHERGTMLMYGPFGDPQREGAMAVFTSREAAEEFAKGDPFVLNGVVRSWQIREWNEALFGDDALSVARAYHDAWTSRRFDEAVALLASELEVEVPINEYPTTESFATAPGTKATLLYDMQVQGLGELRIAEHFTVEDGKIARIRQIHDTAALREAGFDPSEASV